LWRYILGDTIQFTSLFPFRFKITGRTKSFLNTFGEEVVVENAESAIAHACLKTNAQIRDFTVAPIYMENNERGAHEWLIEFVNEPTDFSRFCQLLDENLREINSDYDAKRYKNMILDKPKIHQIPKGTFDRWLKSKDKLGGQNKIPRLLNERTIINEIQHFLSH
jgi:hypothetical protein